MILFEGWCPVHQEIKPFSVSQALAKHPGAWLVAHPEAPPEVVALAQLVASTEGMLDACRQAPATEFVVATETGILHRLAKAMPEKRFYPAEELAVCPYMKQNDLEKIYLALRDLRPEVRVAEAIRSRAFAPIQRMLDLGLPFNDNLTGPGCKC
jgi:quinolinate synthase